MAFYFALLNVSNKNQEIRDQHNRRQSHHYLMLSPLIPKANGSTNKLIKRRNSIAAVSTTRPIVEKYDEYLAFPNLKYKHFSEKNFNNKFSNSSGRKIAKNLTTFCDHPSVSNPNCQSTKTTLQNLDERRFSDQSSRSTSPTIIAASSLFHHNTSPGKRLSVQSLKNEVAQENNVKERENSANTTYQKDSKTFNRTNITNSEKSLTNLNSLTAFHGSNIPKSTLSSLSFSSKHKPILCDPNNTTIQKGVGKCDILNYVQTKKKNLCQILRRNSAAGSFSRKKYTDEKIKVNEKCALPRSSVSSTDSRTSGSAPKKVTFMPTSPPNTSNTKQKKSSSSKSKLADENDLNLNDFHNQKGKSSIDNISFLELNDLKAWNVKAVILQTNKSYQSKERDLPSKLNAKFAPKRNSLPKHLIEDFAQITELKNKKINPTVRRSKSSCTASKVKQTKNKECYHCERRHSAEGTRTLPLVTVTGPNNNINRRGSKINKTFSDYQNNNGRKNIILSQTEKCITYIQKPEYKPAPLIRYSK